jgi:O-antigen/teichoic acid export membrane protein
MGANAYGRINTTQAALGVVRHGGGVILVQFVPEIAALMAWQVLCALAETLIRRKLCGQVLGTAKPSVALVHSEFGASWPAVTRMWGAILLQVVSYQIDKAMVGRLAPIDAFGFYAIASTLAMGVLQLSAPITQAALPQLATLQQRPQEMRRLNRRVGAMMLALVVSGGAVFLLFGEPILRLWLGSGEKAQIVHGPLAALLVGSALNTAYSLGNMNWIAAGSARAVASVNILGLVLTVSLSPMAVAHYGIAGGAVGWVAMNAIGLFASLWWMARTGRL